MATTGYVGIPFPVSVTMHAAVHATHYVGLYANDARLSVDGSTANMIFTPANWNVAQQVLVTGHQPGDLELLAHISNDYFVNGAGLRRFVDGLIDLSVTVIPLDTWVGSTPALPIGAGGGDLGIAHNNLVAGHKAAIGISSGTTTGLTFDSPFPVTSGTTVEITNPLGAVSIATGSGVLGIAMPLLGVYRFRPLMPFCLISAGEVLGHTVQQQDFECTITDAGGGTIIVPTVFKTGVKSQGISVASTGLDYTDFTPAPNGSPVTDTTYPLAGTIEDTVVGAWTFRDLGPIYNSNCSGGAAAVVGKTIVISGVVPGGSPTLGFIAGWSFALVNGGFIPTVSGVDCIPTSFAMPIFRKGICA